MKHYALSIAERRQLLDRCVEDLAAAYFRRNLILLFFGRKQALVMKNELGTLTKRVKYHSMMLYGDRPSDKRTTYIRRAESIPVGRKPRGGYLSVLR